MRRRKKKYSIEDEKSKYMVPINQLPLMIIEHYEEYVRYYVVDDYPISTYRKVNY
jgi:hypothetical protein